MVLEDASDMNTQPLSPCREPPTSNPRRRLRSKVLPLSVIEREEIFPGNEIVVNPVWE